MEITIFYSWQSDLPNSTNRGFIERALEQAAKSIHTDETIKIDPVIDRDTTGVPGSPDIANTIFAKIDQAHVFVCDVSIINQNSNGRKTPNPNVLIELGYAMKQLGSTRIIMLLNDAYGGMNLLPFDLGLKRILLYHMPEAEKDRASERNKLRDKLENALRTMFEREEIFLQQQSQMQIAEQARADIENSLPRQIPSIQQFMKEFTYKLTLLAPDSSLDGEKDELLIASIAQTEKLVYEFSNIVETISAMSAQVVAKEVFEKFTPLLENYRPSASFSGTWYAGDFDYYKFLGHELLVCLVSILIRDGQWNIVANLLGQEIYVSNKSKGQSGLVNFSYFSQDLQTLRHRNDRLKLNRLSIHADIINERHAKGSLAEIVPMDQFMEADFFLFLRAGLKWRPWSIVYLDDKIPRFLVQAVSQKYAQNLFAPLQVENIDSLKKRIVEKCEELRLLVEDPLFYPLEDFALKTIGSRN